MTPDKPFDWANNVILPCLGVLMFWALWYYWGLPWDVIKEVLFHA